MVSSIQVDLPITGDIVFNDRRQEIASLDHTIEKQIECFGARSARRRSIPETGKIGFAVGGSRGRTLRRFGPGEKEPAEAGPVFTQSVERNEVANRDLEANRLTGFDHDLIFPLVGLETERN